MKGVRFTKAERELLEVMLAAATDWTWHTKDAIKLGNSMLEKLRAAVEAPAGVSVKPIEDALIQSSRGKVVPIMDGHSMVSRRLTAMKVTAEQARAVGAYLGRSSFFTGPFTIIDVVDKWYKWLPKAQATEPPPALEPGLGTGGQAQSGQGPAGPGKAPPGRRTPQGFR